MSRKIKNVWEAPGKEKVQQVMTTNHEHWPQLVTSCMKLENFIKHSMGDLLDCAGLRVISQASKSSILGKRKQTQRPGGQEVHRLPRASNSLSGNSDPMGRALLNGTHTLSRPVFITGMRRNTVGKQASKVRCIPNLTWLTLNNLLSFYVKLL